MSMPQSNPRSEKEKMELRRQTSKRARVLMLLENSRYPQDIRVRPEALALIAAGYKVSVICIASKGQRRHEVLNGVHVYRFPAPPAANSVLTYLWEYAYSMVALFVISLVVWVREGFDVIHTANPPDTLVFVAAFYKLFGKRFIYDHHDLAPEMYNARFVGQSNKRIYDALIFFEKLSCRLADHVIATNGSYKRVEMLRGGVPEESITIVRNGPHVGTMQSVPPDPELRGRAGTIIVYMGVIGYQDGVDYLLRALRHLASDLGRTDFHCLVMGKGDALSNIEALSKELDLTDYVSFTGWIDDYTQLVRYLNAADICVAPEPSNYYNDRSTVVKVMEYMAIGKPVIAFDLPEHRFTAEGAALYVRPNDELEFAQAIAELMDDPARREEMGALGQRRVETELAWTYSVPKLLEAYSKVLSGRQGKSRHRAKRRGIHVPASLGRITRFSHWLKLRDASYIFIRLVSLVTRYGITSGKAEKRTREGVEVLARHGCYPTFPIPGRVLSKHGEYCRTLQEMGAELALHGYDHVDFNSLSPAEAARQFARAADTFRRNGIRYDGFRCPYLSYTPDIPGAVQGYAVKYSSNRAIWWDVIPADKVESATSIFDSLGQFYKAESSEAAVSMPSLASEMVEIPVSLPDDLQLYDGLKVGEEGVKRAWVEILRRTHRRGELFTLMFHPESFRHCEMAIIGVLEEARLLQPAVWVAQLRDISNWWLEKAQFTVSTSSDSSGLEVRFHCSERATVLLRNLETEETTRPWSCPYRVLESRTLRLAEGRRPFVGVGPEVPGNVVSFLREQGYILDTGHQAVDCAIYLDAATVARFENEVKLIDYIESSPGPLVRYWPWPDEARSAICITGDLDALSLMDYATRLFTL